MCWHLNFYTNTINYQKDLAVLIAGPSPAPLRGAAVLAAAQNKGPLSDYRNLS